MKNLISSFLPASAKAGATVPHEVPPELRPKRILLVDDSPDVANLVQIVVSGQLIADLTMINSVRAAMEALQGEGEAPFDVVILDVRLSNGTGLTIYREIFRKWPQLRVVFLTGYDNPKMREEVEAIGPARVHDKTRALQLDFFIPMLEEMGVRRRGGSTPPFPAP